jgi:hypothetical protein
MISAADGLFNGAGCFVLGALDLSSLCGSFSVSESELVLEPEPEDDDSSSSESSEEEELAESRDWCWLAAATDIPFPPFSPRALASFPPLSLPLTSCSLFSNSAFFLAASVTLFFALAAHTNTSSQNSPTTPSKCLT